MAALDLGYLLRAANTGLASARQGTRERQALERQQQQEEATRLFNEWAKRNQADFQNRQLEEQSRLREATIGQTGQIAQMRNETALSAQQNAMERAKFQAEVQRQLAEMRDATTRRGQNLGSLDIKIGTDGRPYVLNPGEQTTRQMQGEGQFPLAGAGTGRVTEGQRTAAAQYEMMKPAYDRLKQRFEAGWNPSTMDKIGETIKAGVMPDFLGNFLQSDEGQQMYDDLTAIILSSQYALSGKAVTEPEARKLARGLMPQIGDKPERAAQKKSEIATRLRVVMAAGGATNGIDEPPPPRLGAKYPENPYRRP